MVPAPRFVLRALTVVVHDRRAAAARLCAGLLVIACVGCAPSEQPPGSSSDAAGWPPALTQIAEQARDRFDAPTLSVDEAAQLAVDALVVDVRTPEEIGVSRIRGALALDSDSARRAFLEARRSSSAADPAGDAVDDRTILVYCTAGWRSAEFAAALADVGLPAWNVEGGICAWAASGREIVDGVDQPTRRIHAYSDAFEDCVPATHQAVTEPAPDDG